MARNGWTEPLYELRERLANLQGVMAQVGEEVVLPALGRRYVASGLKQRKGRMYAAITKRGAPGNVFETRGNRLSCGIDYGSVPYAKFQLEGTRTPIRPRKPGGVLRFVIDGKVFYRKWVRGVPAKLVYRLTAEDMAEANQVASKSLIENLGVRQVRR